MNTIQITEQPNTKTSELLEMCRAKFPVWSYYENAQLDADFPAPKEATTRHFLNQQEPDKETLGLSTRQAEKKGFKNGITIRERILLELSYFDQTGNHLDIKGLTFCSGSRDSGGGVPDAHWLAGEFRIGWYDLDYSDSDYGIRSAVSLDSLSSIPSDLEDIEIHEAVNLLKSKGYQIAKIL